MEPVYIVFTQGKGNQWWKRPLKNGYGHCFIVKSICADYFWLSIDPLYSFTDIVTIPKSAGDLRDFLPEDAKVVEIHPKIDNNCAVFTISCNTCVDTVKRFLGISKPFIITPWQLYKYLIRCQDGISIQ